MENTKLSEHEITQLGRLIREHGANSAAKLLGVPRPSLLSAYAGVGQRGTNILVSQQLRKLCADA